MPDVDLSSVGTLLGKLTWMDIVSSVVILCVCLIVSQVIVRVIRRAAGHTQLDTRLQKLLVSILRGFLYVITAIIVAQSLGIPSTSLVALLSVVSLAISLSLQGMLSNVAGGITLLTARPIALGDVAEVAGVSGVVDEIGLLYTKLHTADGQVVMLPNSNISAAQVINYSTLGERRITVVISASYDNDSGCVRQALTEAASAVPMIHSEPAPQAYLSNFLDSGMEYTLYAWSSASDYVAARFALINEVKLAFDKHNIEIPYNRLDVHVQNGDTLFMAKESVAAKL